MELFEFFEPVDIEDINQGTTYEEATWYHAIDMYTGEKPDLSGKKIALIGIGHVPGEYETANTIRKYLYSLKRAEYAEDIIDMGNLFFNYKQKSYEELAFILSELMSQNIAVIILNGGQEITYSQYLAFAYLKQYVSLVCFDAKLDFDLQERTKMTSADFLQKIFMEEPNYLFGYSGIGYQSYFADTNIVDFLEKLFFELLRLGDIRNRMAELEPVLRSAHFGSWDLGSIRQADAPGTAQPSPNGFYGEEACLLSRYAGLSNNMRTIGFYNYEPVFDQNGQTAHLCAQMIWYFVDGFLNRYPENPSENKEDFLKFITSIQDNAYQIVFYKSKRSDRWWMEVPMSERDFAGQNYIMPCSYNDYQAATRGEIPDRWLQALRKLS